MTKIVIVYIVYDLDAMLKNPINNLKYKNCLFGAINIVKTSDKRKHVYAGYGIRFDRAGSWSFDRDFARNVIIFDVDDSSSSYSDNRKNNFLILIEGPTYENNGRFRSSEKKFSIVVTKANAKFRLSLHYNADKGYLFFNWKEIFKLKSENRNNNFQTQLCLGSSSVRFSATESSEVSLNRNVYDFSVDYNYIDKTYLLNILKSLMATNKIK